MSADSDETPDSEILEQMSDVLARLERQSGADEIDSYYSGDDFRVTLIYEF